MVGQTPDVDPDDGSCAEPPSLWAMHKITLLCRAPPPGPQHKPSGSADPKCPFINGMREPAASQASISTCRVPQRWVSATETPALASLPDRSALEPRKGSVWWLQKEPKARNRNQEPRCHGMASDLSVPQFPPLNAEARPPLQQALTAHVRSASRWRWQHYSPSIPLFLIPDLAFPIPFMTLAGKAGKTGHIKKHIKYIYVYI